MNWHDLFSYDPDTGKLKWKSRPNGRVPAGSIAGFPEVKGYWQVGVKGKYYKVHRVIWEMHNGPIPKGIQIDHINHIKDDNRLENLRLVTNAGNSRNRSLAVNNASGCCGVSWYPRYSKWMAYITLTGKRKTLGYFNSLEEAVSARKAAEQLYDYHPNHGLAKELAA